MNASAEVVAEAAIVFHLLVMTLGIATPFIFFTSTVEVTFLVAAFLALSSMD